jgi:ATP-dependent exoDNAse (exonuclease V) alpha subunit
MLLRNLNPSQGLYNGTWMILVDWSNSLLKCHILRQDGNQDDHIVLIPRMSLLAGGEDNPIPLKRRQFPVCLAFSMMINKSQGQSVKWVGLDLRSPVFSHGQLYVALSRCTHPNRVKAIFPEHKEGTSTINVVYREVFRGFEISLKFVLLSL